MAEVIVQEPIRTVYPDSIVISNVKSKIDNSTTSYSVVTTWYDGTSMDDSKVDQWGVFTKYKATGEYLRENKPLWGEQFLEVNTMAQLRTISSYFLFLVKIGYYKGIRLSGYYTKGDTPAPIDYYMSSTTDPDNGGSVVIVQGITLEYIFTNSVNGAYFGLSSGLPDNYNNLIRLFDYTKKTGLKAVIPPGEFKYSQTINFLYPNAKLQGHGLDTVLKFTGSGAHAFEMDAFKNSNNNTQYVLNLNVSDIIFSGNANTTITLYLRGIAHNQFNQVFIGDGKPTSDGYGIYLASVQLSKFHNCGCTNQRYNMTSRPYTGVFLGLGQRGTVTAGSSTNNTFDQTYWEGLSIGVLMSDADNNTFTGGSAENNSVYGITIGQRCKINKFDGVGLEANPVDISDFGRGTTFNNCYFGNIFRVGSTGRQIKAEGCMFSRIEIQSGAIYTTILNSVYNRWADKAKGVSDLGTFTRLIGLNDHDKDPENTAPLSSFDKNNYSSDGFMLADSYKVKIKNDALTPVNNVDTIGGFTPFIATDTSYWPSNGAGLAVDRTGNYNNSNSVGSFKIFSKANGLEELYFTKKLTGNGLLSDWSTIRRLIHSNDLASTTVKGIVGQSANVSNSTAVLPTNDDASTAADVPGVVTDLNDLVSRYNSLLTVVSDLQSKLNSKLTNDRTSGQQSIL